MTNDLKSGAPDADGTVSRGHDAPVTAPSTYTTTESGEVVADTRAAVQEVLTEQRFGVLAEISDEDVAQSVQTLRNCNYGFMETGVIPRAIEVFAIAGATEKLIELGNVLLEKGLLKEGQYAYRAAGKEIPTEKIIECGDSCLRFAFYSQGWVDKALEAYASVKATDQLVRLGDWCLVDRILDTARVAYTIAGSEILKSKLIEIGNRSLEIGYINEAYDAYVEAGAKEKVVVCGDAFIERGNYPAARRAYAFAGMSVPPAKLVTYGNVCFEKGDLDNARTVYEAAGATEKLIACGDLYLGKRLFDEALKAYEAAGAAEKLVMCGDLCLDDGRFTLARKAYEAAGVENPTAKLVSHGDRCRLQGENGDALGAYKAAGVEIPSELHVAIGDQLVNRGNPDDARHYYIAAGATEKLIHSGDLCLDKGLLDDARKAYEAAGVEIPKEKLVASGDKYLERGWFEPAQYAYKAAGIVLPTETFIAHGDRCMEKGQYMSACSAYKVALSLGSKAK